MGRRLTSSPTDNTVERRRPGRLSGRRAALLLTALITGSLLISPVATASAGFDPVLVTATVFTSAGAQAPESLTLSALENCAPAYAGPSTMEQWNAAGENTPAALPTESTGPGQGTWALASALNCMSPSIPVSTISSVVVINGNSGENPLSQADLQQPGDFENTAESPVIAVSGSYEDYYRPRRNSSDANAVDTVGPNAVGSPDSDDPIALQVFDAKTFKVTISAPTTSVTAGQSITFESTDQAPPGDSVDDSWSVDGQTQGTDAPTQTLTFPSSGSFEVGLAVTDPSADEVGAAAPVTITVSPAAAETTTTATTTTPTQSGTSTLPVGGSGSAGSGPSQSTGTTPGANAGAQSTQSTPASQGAATTPTLSSPEATTTRAPSPTTTSTAGSPTRTSTAPASAAASDTTLGPGGGAASGGKAASSGMPSRSPGTSTTTTGGQHVSRRLQPVARRPRSGASPRLVSGLLVEEPGPPASGAIPERHQASSDGHAPALAPIRQDSALVGWAAAVGALALLGLGVGRELRGRRSRGRRNHPRTA